MRTELQSDHAAELEDLRDYYEKKLKDMENRLKRELEMLQSEQESEVGLKKLPRVAFISRSSILVAQVSLILYIKVMHVAMIFTEIEGPFIFSLHDTSIQMKSVGYSLFKCKS